MKKTHFIRSLFAAALVLCLFAVDLTPALAAQKVTQQQINALKNEASDLNAQKKEIQ